MTAGLEAHDFAGCLADVEVPGAWALAVSGGSDSTALMLLAADWARAEKHSLPLVVSVDHALRAGSRDEARTVAGWARDLGLCHTLLTWEGSKPTANVQSAARNARYRAIGDWCLSQNVAAVFAAHTLDDQAETVLLRLARGSGVDGLSAMSKLSAWPIPDRAYADLRLVRPLLGIERARLRATLVARRQAWLDDPSNEDTRFERVRVRETLGVLASLGITASGLAATARRLQRARDALERDATALWDEAAALHPAGAVLLDGALLAEAPAEIAVRALARALYSVGSVVPRHHRLVALYEALCGRGPFGAGRTLAGCRIVREAGRVAVLREPRALARRLAAEPARTWGLGESVFWDNRFEVRFAGAGSPRHGFVGPLGRNAASKLMRDNAAFRDALEPLGIAAAETLPGFWEAGALLAVPFVGLLECDPWARALPEAAQFSATFLPKVEWLSR